MAHVAIRSPLWFTSLQQLHFCASYSFKCIFIEFFFILLVCVCARACVKVDLNKHSLVRCVLFAPIGLDVRHRIVTKELMRAGK